MLKSLTMPSQGHRVSFSGALGLVLALMLRYIDVTVQGNPQGRPRNIDGEGNFNRQNIGGFHSCCLEHNKLYE